MSKVIIFYFKTNPKIVVATKLKNVFFFSFRYGGHGGGNERLFGQPARKQQVAIVGRENAIQTAIGLATAGRKLRRRFGRKLF